MAMHNTEQIINLDLPPLRRWEFLKEHVTEIRELLQYYLNDLQGADSVLSEISNYKYQIIPAQYLEEIEFIASISGFSPDQVLIANLYYDVLKFYLGCTAFAIENNGVILHSRNLDWHTENNLLGKHSTIFDFQRKGKTIFKTVGWPGFIGALSGIRSGAFSLTLNAVSSNDQPEIALPVSFLLRDILDSAESFQEAKIRLENTTIASDCLILLSGVQPNQMAVIERTPKRSSTRTAENSFIIVTNDYKQLENNLNGESLLQSTSCGRYNKTELLINTRFPKNSEDCLEILKNKEVMMGITVQQMVFENNSGKIKLIKTGIS